MLRSHNLPLECTNVAWFDLEVERLLYREGGWDLDALDDSARDSLVGDLTNRYLLEGYPELQKFEG